MSLPFAAALRAAQAPVIAEIKPSSPKNGALIKPSDVARIAADYCRAGAPCLSVTTGAWHKGSLDMIAPMAATGLPVLRKDFITSRKDLKDTVAAGASAALLTCAILRPLDIERLANEALDLGLTPFVEAASSAEIARIALPEGSILAINNRDIRCQEIDDGGVERSLSLATRARRKHTGLLVSASGLTEPVHVTTALINGFDGVLVGTALLSDPSGPYRTTRRFLDAARQTLPVAS